MYLRSCDIPRDEANTHFLAFIVDNAALFGNGFTLFTYYPDYVQNLIAGERTYRVCEYGIVKPTQSVALTIHN